MYKADGVLFRYMRVMPRRTGMDGSKYVYTLECDKYKRVIPYHPLVINGVLVHQQFQCSVCMEIMSAHVKDRYVYYDEKASPGNTNRTGTGA